MLLRAHLHSARGAPRCGTWQTVLMSAGLRSVAGTLPCIPTVAGGRVPVFLTHPFPPQAAVTSTSAPGLDAASTSAPGLDAASMACTKQETCCRVEGNKKQGGRCWDFMKSAALSIYDMSSRHLRTCAQPPGRSMPACPPAAWVGSLVGARFYLGSRHRKRLPCDLLQIAGPRQGEEPEGTHGIVCFLCVQPLEMTGTTGLAAVTFSRHIACR